MRIIIFPRYSFPFLLCLVFILGCSTSITMTPQGNGSELVPLPSLTTNPPATETPSLSPSQAVTYTPTPLPPTSTFLPTLAVQNPESMALNLYATNGGCKLPCWWGIIPGETSWESARNFLEPFSLKINKYFNERDKLNYYYSHFKVPENVNLSEDVNIGFRVNDGGFVDFITTANPWRIKSPDYSLSYILSTYGIPSEVRFVATANSPHIGKPFYTYYLFYFDLGILTASSNVGYLTGDNIEICPQNYSETPILLLWDKNLGYTFDYLNENRFIINTHFPKFNFLDLEDISNFNVDHFYETFLVPGALECIETPLAIWE